MSCLLDDDRKGLKKSGIERKDILPRISPEVKEIINNRKEVEKIRNALLQENQNEINLETMNIIKSLLPTIEKEQNYARFHFDSKILEEHIKECSLAVKNNEDTSEIMDKFKNDFLSLSDKYFDNTRFDGKRILDKANELAENRMFADLEKEGIKRVDKLTGKARESVTDGCGVITGLLLWFSKSIDRVSIKMHQDEIDKKCFSKSNDKIDAASLEMTLDNTDLAFSLAQYFSKNVLMPDKIISGVSGAIIPIAAEEATAIAFDRDSNKSLSSFMNDKSSLQLWSKLNSSVQKDARNIIEALKDEILTTLKQDSNSDKFSNSQKDYENLKETYISTKYKTEFEVANFALEKNKNLNADDPKTSALYAEKGNELVIKDIVNRITTFITENPNCSTEDIISNNIKDVLNITYMFSENAKNTEELKKFNKTAASLTFDKNLLTASREILKRTASIAAGVLLPLVTTGSIVPVSAGAIVLGCYNFIAELENQYVDSQVFKNGDKKIFRLPLPNEVVANCIYKYVQLPRNIMTSQKSEIEEYVLGPKLKN